MGVGGALLSIYVAYRQRRGSARPKNEEACGRPSDEHATASRRSTAQTVPVEVVAKKLSAGWASAPPIFYPPNLAVIPILRPDAVKNDLAVEQNDFILCDGPRLCMLQTPAGDEENVKFYLEYLQNMPILQTLATHGTAVLPLKEVGFSCASECFTHAVVIPDKEMLVFFGRHGPYLLSFVMTQYASSPLKSENGKNTVEKLTPGNIQMLLDACRVVPLVDGLRLAGTPVGAGKGSLRLTYRHGNNVLVFALSPSLTVRQNVEPEGKGDNDALRPLFFIEGEVLREKRIGVGSDALGALVRGTSVDALFPPPTPAHPPVSSLVSLVAVEELAAPVANGVGGRAPLPHGEDAMSIVFSHPYLGVSFSVNPKTGVVHEPILAEDLLVLYWPLGDETRRSLPSGPGEGVAPPRVSIRRLTQPPPTWEKFLSTEDELRHNVLFHFTDWTTERVPCTMCDVNGLQGVQLFESKEGRSCRTYVIPRGDVILVVRWETESKDWDAHLTLLQRFLDTLLLAEPLA
ncbi:uncharacterized protein Tco025E_05071 [Trypanosoma conorhini]|uniref:Present in the outer mitochondrial membrane proteome 7 n=1 Tax=Trypanosoma conorhini TaxID=83891 RepID=A0A422PHE0_9TRYP|nr:uncharacterized protein Tco025E_05071 [Trypanosoma conorhini]RNF17142.1 hypothetical protein Tco025E_05071 [Trypanosoma conorhini]